MDPSIQLIPLTGAELHLRLILQSLAYQSSEKWNGIVRLKPVNGESLHSYENRERLSSADATYKMAVAARDFMVIRIPSHELTDSEVVEMEGAADEARMVIAVWEVIGGLWVGDGTARHHAWIHLGGADREAKIHERMGSTWFGGEL